MKKFLTLLLALCMVLALGACGAKEAPAADSGSAPVADGGSAPAAEPAANDDPITITMQLTFPEDAAAGVQSVVDAIEAESNGRVKFDIYYSFSFVENADVVDALQTNQLDIAGLMPHEFPALFPLSGTLAYMPMYNYPSWDASTQIYLNTLYSTPDMMAEFEDNGLVLWGAYMCPGYQIFINEETTDYSPSVYNGRTVMCDNAQMQQFINGNQGAAISVFPPDFLSNLQNGVADTLMQHVNCAFAFGCFEYVDTAIFFGEGGFCNVPLALCMSEDFWNGLPADVQDLLAKYSDDLCYACQMSDVELYENVAIPTLEQNAEIVVLNDEQIAQWQTAVQPIVDATLADLKNDSPNVEAVYAKFKDTIASYDAATFTIGTNNFGIDAVWG